MNQTFLVAFNKSRGLRIAKKVLKAGDFESRSRGLLGRDSLEPEEALWIVPCPMIHTFFMRFAIDVVFLDSELKVVRVIERIKPWRISPWVFRARSVLELGGGSLQGRVLPGEMMEFQ